MKKILITIAATLLSCFLLVAFVGCEDTVNIERITDIDVYSDMKKQADKIDVGFDNGTQERFKFSITDENDIKEIIEYIFFDTLIDLGKQLQPPGGNTYITIYQGEKVYSLSVLFFTVNGKLYTFSTRNLSNKITELAIERGAFVDPYEDYISSGLVPKTTIGNDGGNYVVRQELTMITDYSDYLEYEIDLGYTQGFFELNNLMIFGMTGGSSNAFAFVEVLEYEGALYPVVEQNYIAPGQPVTEDVIHHVFYVEVPLSESYSGGEVIMRTRSQNIVL